ncbi:ATP-grasp domain-containing protein [Methylobacterium segetis]|uniref:ATP-grasp domain-containing protein n=1 Tax=Methylobacterium segetis TaxID=2488750 RepID=UPI001FE1F7AC|nr:ATP-grasp domain-containing protein [Methylobacterium segetis]
MVDGTVSRRRLRILLSEGGSTSAREAITALALAGHEVSYCDPERVCLGRFSRLVARRYRCPPLGSEPESYRVFVRDLLATGRFDVLLPIHEQGYLFARIADEVRPHAALAVPPFESYARLHSKLGFSRLLDALGLSQPRTTILEDGREVRRLEDYPFVLKAALGTASRGTWIVRDAPERDRAAAELSAAGTGLPVLVQAWIDAPLEQAQAVFQGGRLVGFHAARRLIEGGGGGAALKESVARPQVLADMARIGEALAWHGALSLEYFLDAGQRPLYIDGNPRLVEPMGAALSGLCLTDLLIGVSLGEAPAGVATSRPGIRTRLALQALIGEALRSGSRAALLRTGRDLLARRGAFARAEEELSPAGLDPPSAIPVVVAALSLLARPSRAAAWTRGGWSRHLLTPEAVRTIEAMR